MQKKKVSTPNIWASLVAQLVKNLPAMQEIWVQFLGWEDPLEKGKATHFTILAWRIPWTGWGCKESDTTERLSLSRFREAKCSQLWWPRWEIWAQLCPMPEQCPSLHWLPHLLPQPLSLELLSWWFPCVGPWTERSHEITHPSMRRKGIQRRPLRNLFCGLKGVLWRI